MMREIVVAKTEIGRRVAVIVKTETERRIDLETGIVIARTGTVIEIETGTVIEIGIEIDPEIMEKTTQRDPLVLPARALLLCQMAVMITGQAAVMGAKMLVQQLPRWFLRRW